MRRPVIGVMGPGRADGVEATAYELGRLIAREGWILLTGGRNAGVMDAASRGARSVPGSITVGVLPGDHRSADVSGALDIAIFTNMGAARNAINVESSDVVVAIAGASAGTLSEIALAVKANKRVVLLGATQTTAAFIAEWTHAGVELAADPEDAVRRIKGYGIGREAASNPR